MKTRNPEMANMTPDEKYKFLIGKIADGLLRFAVWRARERMAKAAAAGGVETGKEAVP